MNSFQTFNPLSSQIKKKPVMPVSDSVIESLREVGSNVGQTVSKDVVSQISQDALTSLLGQTPQSGELHHNQEIVFTTERQSLPVHKHVEHMSRPAVQLVEKGIEQKIEAVRQELKLLSSSMNTLNTEIQKAVSDIPVHPGVYHITFFERIRSMLVLIRTQIEDSRSWLTMWTTRKKKRGFWNLYKKHGTKFGLSSERTVATQAG